MYAYKPAYLFVLLLKFDGTTPSQKLFNEQIVTQYVAITFKDHLVWKKGSKSFHKGDDRARVWPHDQTIATPLVW